MMASGDSVEAELRVGMLDMALAKLLSDQHHTIEFPTLLLPVNVEAGSIVRLTCTRAAKAELEDAEQFNAVQNKILESFATHLPSKPVLSTRNITQTSVVLEWDPIDIASADLRYLALYKDSQRLGLIPQALKRTSMKVSNLEIDMPYRFKLVLSTSAGDFESDELEVQTHKLSDLSGVVVCLGSLNHSSISAEEIGGTLERLGCKPAQSTINLDTTHFLCTTEGGSQYERAMDLSIPIVRPEWLKACEAERKLVSVRGYYLNADPQLVPPPRQRVIESSNASVQEQRRSEQSSRVSSESQLPKGVAGTTEPADTASDPADESRRASPVRGSGHHVRFSVPDAESDLDSGVEPHQVAEAEPAESTNEVGTLQSQEESSAPAEPESIEPEPTEPESTEPEPTEPESAEPESAEPEPAETEPTEQEAAEAEVGTTESVPANEAELNVDHTDHADTSGSGSQNYAPTEETSSLDHQEASAVEASENEPPAAEEAKEPSPDSDIPSGDTPETLGSPHTEDLGNDSDEAAGDGSGKEKSPAPAGASKAKKNKKKKSKK